MSTHRHSHTTATARQAAVCMCVWGQSCTSFAAGHAVHLIQARVVAATPSEWVDAIVTEAQSGEITLRTLDGLTVTLWNAAGAQNAVTTGEPVAYHPRYHALSAAGRLFNVATI